VKRDLQLILLVTKTGHLILYDPFYSISSVGNLTDQNSCVYVIEFAAGVWIPEVRILNIRGNDVTASVTDWRWRVLIPTADEVYGYCWSWSWSEITTDSQSASPSWCQAPIWDPRPIYLSLETFFGQLRSCYVVEPSLARGRVCNLLCCWSSPTQSRGTEDHILLSQSLRLLQPAGPGPRIYIPQEQARYTPWHWVYGYCVSDGIDLVLLYMLSSLRPTSA
jgi:hypothetical protein